MSSAHLNLPCDSEVTRRTATTDGTFLFASGYSGQGKTTEITTTFKQ